MPAEKVHVDDLAARARAATAGLSQTAIAEALGISQAAVSQALAGQQPATALRILRHYAVIVEGPFYLIETHDSSLS